MTDPQPVLNWYRIVSFVIFLCSGLALMTAIPQGVKDWLPIISLVASGALTIFFGVAASPSPNPSIANRVASKLSPDKPEPPASS